MIWNTLNIEIGGIIIDKSNYKVQILNSWIDDGKYVDFLIYDKDKGKIAHCCEYFTLSTFPDDMAEKSILSHPKRWFNLPKTSEIYDVTYQVFNDLCNTDNGMLWIEGIGDKECYGLDNSKVMEKFKEDIYKYRLEDYVEFDENDNITVYGGFVCCFNDDRGIPQLSSDKVYLVSKSYVENNIDTFNKTNNTPYNKLIFQDGEKYIAIDDSRSQCYVEEFNKLEEATLWLKDDSLSYEEVVDRAIPSYITNLLIIPEEKHKEENYEL